MLQDEINKEQVKIKDMRGNGTNFSPLMFVARLGDTEALNNLIKLPDIGINDQDDKGFTAAVMVTAMEGHVEAFHLLVYAGANVKLCNKLDETTIGLSEFNQKRGPFEKVLLEFNLEKGNNGTGGFHVLHCAARRGDFVVVRLLASRGYDVNIPDGDDYTPLMLAAREGHGSMCEFLISKRARCDIKTAKGETVLSLARMNTILGSKIVKHVIQDELAWVFVLNGASVKKHTKGGKGKTHRKVMRMIGAVGILRWGKSSRRNLICKEAEVSPSATFERNRQRKGDAYEPEVFRIVTTKNIEFHFVCECGIEAVEMWVRGIKLVTRDTIFGNND